jgi:predicted DNA-binding transcriptional regulator AlpA
MPESPYLDRLEAAKFLKLSRATLDKLKAAGEGPKFVKINHRIVYDQADLTAWMDSKKKEPTPCV